MDDDKKYCYKYPRPAVTTDCVLLSPDGGQMQVLLVERGHEPYKGCWALPGGFINIDEDAPAACRRELKEETGIAADALTEVGRDISPERHAIYVAFLCVTDRDKADIALQEGETVDFRWVSREALLSMDGSELLPSRMKGFIMEKNL